MKSNRCWVIPPPALSARRRPSGACLLDGSAFGTGEFRDGTSNEAVLCGSAFLKVNKGQRIEQMVVFALSQQYILLHVLEDALQRVL